MFHIIKSSRIYDGRGYKGVSSNNVPMEFEHIKDAIEQVDILTHNNPVGWVIYDSVTKQQLFSEDNI